MGGSPAGRLKPSRANRKEDAMPSTIPAGKQAASGVRLTGSSFEDVCLADARFDDVNLTGATFHNVNLINARFDDVNLSGVEVTNANLTGMKINGVPVTDLFAAYGGPDCHRPHPPK
jgi:uncharacterized protein YjbI with pentapeptide repeats